MGLRREGFRFSEDVPVVAHSIIPLHSLRDRARELNMSFKSENLPAPKSANYKHLTEYVYVGRSLFLCASEAAFSACM